MRRGLTVTPTQAEELLRDDLRRFEKAVEDVAPHATDNQFSALASLAFNIGTGSFKTSTVLRRHRAGDHKGAAAAFSMWVKATVKGRKVTLKGLVTRRAKEASLYLKRD